MNPLFSRFGSVFGFLVVAACSAPPAGTLGSNDQDQTADGDEKLPASSTSATDPAKSSNPAPNTPIPSSDSVPAAGPEGGASTTPPTAGSCSSSADWMSCVDCCGQQNPGGFEVDGQAWNDCICQTACASACGANYCNGGDPSAACEQCMQNAPQCDQAAETACQANASCAAAIACVQNSQCEAKP
jgi:hypothetical protein